MAMFSSRDLTPTERAVFPLREVLSGIRRDRRSPRQECGRGAADRAPGAVTCRRAPSTRLSADPRRARRVPTAIETGDLQGLVDVLAPDVVPRAMAGSEISPAAAYRGRQAGARLLVSVYQDRRRDVDRACTKLPGADRPAHGQTTGGGGASMTPDHWAHRAQPAEVVVCAARLPGALVRTAPSHRTAFRQSATAATATTRSIRDRPTEC